MKTVNFFILRNYLWCREVVQKWPVSRLLQTLVNPRHIVQRWWSTKRLPTCVACLTFSLFYLVCRDFAQHPKDDGLLHGGFLLLLGAERREVLETTAQFCDLVNLVPRVFSLLENEKNLGIRLRSGVAVILSSQGFSCV